MLTYLYDQIITATPELLLDTLTMISVTSGAVETTGVPRRVNIQHIKGLANILANSVSRLNVLGIYHNVSPR